MQPNVIRGAGVAIDLDLRTVSTGTGPVRLTRFQYEILHALATRRRVVSHAALISVLYPDPDEEPGDPDGMVKTIICTLRQRLRQAGAPDVVKKVWGVGYVFAGHEATS